MTILNYILNYYSVTLPWKLKRDTIMDQKSSEKKSENSPKSVNPNDISHNHSNKIPLNNYAQPLPNYAFTPGYPYPSYYPSAPWYIQIENVYY